MKRSADIAAGRARRWFGEVPLSLATLVAIVALAGVTWAVVVAPWQSPDEVAHYAYVESLAERFALPGSPGRIHPMSTDQGLADAAVGASRGAFFPGSSPPDWSARDYARYLDQARRAPSRTNGGGPNPSRTDPPLYYLYADLAYWAASSGNALDRLYAIRIWGVLLLALTALAAWLLAGEVLGRRRLLQLVCAAVAALVPSETFIATSVTPDALMTTLWTLAFWLGARVINRGARRRDAFALCAVTAAAILTKATSYALVPAVLVALAIGWRRWPAPQRRGLLPTLGGPLLVLVLPVLGWVAETHAMSRPAVNTIPSGGPSARPFIVRQFLSYVWQFYLPRLPGMTRSPLGGPLPVYSVWLREGWATFGWLDVWLPGWVYVLLATVTGLILAGTAALVARLRSGRAWPLIAFFALALAALLAGLHLTEYRSIIAGRGALLQGRYLLPAIGLLGLAVAFLLAHLPARGRAAACGLVLAGLLVLQVLSLSTVIQAYYV